VTQRGLCGRPHDREKGQLCWSPACDSRRAVEAAGYRRVARARFLVAGIDEASHAHIPQRVGRHRVRQVAEGDGRHRSGRPRDCVERRHERRSIGIEPELVVNALIELPRRRQPPRELRKDLVLLVRPRAGRVGAWLVVVVAQVLVAPEEPETLRAHGPAEVRRQVAVSRSTVSTLPSSGRHREDNRLARETGCLRMVRGVVQETLTSLPGDDVDDGALRVSELGGRSDGLDLNFLYEVDAWLGARDAVARAGEVRAVEEKLILVGPRSERRHRRVRPARRRCGRDTRRGPDRVEHARPPRRDRLEILWTKACPESGVARLDPRACPLDDDRFGQAGHVQDGGPLDGGAGPDGDGVFVIAVKPLELDVERIRSGRQRLEAQLALFVGGQRHRAADQSRRTDANAGAR